MATLLEGYQETQVLTSSIFGKVVRAKCCGTSRNVVIKISARTLVEEGISRTGNKVLENPIREAEILQKLQEEGEGVPDNQAAGWKNIVPLIEVREEQGNHYLVMEDVGPDLFQHVQKTKLSQTCVKIYFHQLLSAVSCLKANNLCHLDLSLENVLVHSPDKQRVNDVLKLCDFGLCREIPHEGHKFQYPVLPPGNDSKKILRGRPGKLRYMSPEVYANEPFDGHLADVFSLGVILFTLLFQCFPWNKPSPDDPLFCRLCLRGELAQAVHKWGTKLDDQGLNLLASMLCPEQKRCSAQSLLSHPWFAPSTTR